jgi:hypothetical protein
LKKSLNRCGQTFKFTTIKDLGLNRNSSGFDPAAQFSRAGFPMGFSEEDSSSHDSGQDKQYEKHHFPPHDGFLCLTGL